MWWICSRCFFPEALVLQCEPRRDASELTRTLRLQNVEPKRSDKGVKGKNVKAIVKEEKTILLPVFNVVVPLTWYQAVEVAVAVVSEAW